MILKSIFLLFVSLIFLFIHSYNYNIEEIKTCIENDLPIYLKQTYDNWIEYKTYLQNKANEVDKNELQLNHGKRLPILVSTEDYLYTILHYSPSSIKEYVKQKQQYQSTTTTRTSSKITSIERQEQFHKVIMNLPLVLQKDALETKEHLSQFISTLPKENHISELLDERYNEWIQYKSHLNELLKDIRHRIELQLDTHSTILDEKWKQQQKEVEKEKDNNDDNDHNVTLEDLFKNNDHYISARELYLKWSNEKIEIDQKASRQQLLNHQWGLQIEKRFVENSFALGPLRSLAESMFDDAKTNTIQLLNQYTFDHRDILLEWNTYSKTVLDDFIQYASNISTITNMEDLQLVYQDMMKAIQRCESAIPVLKGPHAIEKKIIHIWKNANDELSYTPLQKVYWKDLWERKKLQVKLFFKRSLNRIDEYIG